MSYEDMGINPMLGPTDFGDTTDAIVRQLSSLGLDQPKVVGNGIVPEPMTSGDPTEAQAREERKRLAEAQAIASTAAPVKDSGMQENLASILSGVLAGAAGVGSYGGQNAMDSAAATVKQLISGQNAEAASAHAQRVAEATKYINNRLEMAKTLKMLYQAQPTLLKKNALMSELLAPFDQDNFSIFDGAAGAPSSAAAAKFWLDQIPKLKGRAEKAYAYNQAMKAKGLDYRVGPEAFAEGGLSANYIAGHAVDPQPYEKEIAEKGFLSPESAEKIEWKVPVSEGMFQLKKEQSDAITRLADIMRSQNLDRPEAMMKLGERDQIVLDMLEKDPVFRNRVGMEDMTRIVLGLHSKDEKIAGGRWGDATYAEDVYNAAIGVFQQRKQDAADKAFLLDVHNEQDQIKKDEPTLSDEEAERKAIKHVWAENKSIGREVSADIRAKIKKVTGE